MKNKNILPPTYLLVAIVTIVALHFLFPLATIVPFPWNFLGLIPFFIGIAINIIAARHFKKVGTTIKPYEPSSTLVTTGLFTFSRNPMYIGATLILLGLAAFLGSLTPISIAIGFPILMDRLFIPVEEAMLEERFGEAWTDYKKKQDAGSRRSRSKTIEEHFIRQP